MLRTIKICIIYSVLIAGFFSCQSENEKDLYGDTDNDTIPTVGELAYFSFDNKLTPEQGSVNGTLNGGNPDYISGIQNEASTALELDGSDYFMINLGTTYDSLALILWIKNNNPVNSSYLPYLIDYGFGYSGARLDLDATSGATFAYISSDSITLPASDAAGDYRINSTEDWCLVYFECTGGHSRTVIKYTHNSFPFTINNSQEVPYGTSSATEIVTIGKGSEYFGQYDMLDGAIDELHIYNTFLTMAEIQAYYDNRK